MEKIVQTAGRNTLGEFAPEFAHFNDDVLFGENWNNQDIDVNVPSSLIFIFHGKYLCLFVCVSILPHHKFTSVIPKDNEGRR